MRLIVTILLIASLARAEDVTPHDPQAFVVDRAAIVVNEKLLYVGRGVFMDEPVATRTAQKLAALEAENQKLNSRLSAIEAQPDMAPWKWLVAAAVTGLVVGFAASQAASR